MPRSTIRPGPSLGPSPSSPLGPPLAVDPICSSADALAVVSLAIHRPLETETIAFFLDETSRSSTITIVSGTTEPDSVLSIAECMALAGAGSATLCGLVLATVRPDTSGMLPGDIERWLEAGSITDSYGIELIEWFIIGPAGVECPRRLLGEPDRW